MARKRLLMILAGAVAVIGLQAGPAAALDVDAELESVEVEASLSEDGVEATLDTDDDDGDGDGDGDDGDDGDDGGEVEAEVSDDGVDAKVGDAEASTSDVTEPVEDEAEETADADLGDEPTSGGTADDESTSSQTSRSRSSGGEVTTAGDAGTVERERGEPLDAEQARRFLPSSEGHSPSGGHDDVTPGFDLSAYRNDGIDDPIVAAPPEQDAGPRDWESVSPEQDRSDAELAAIPAGPEGSSVPAGLKLLAGLLVAGTGTVWHLTRRELATSTTGPQVA